MEQLEYRFKLFDFTLKKYTEITRGCTPPKIDRKASCNSDYMVSYPSGNSYSSIDFTNISDHLRQLHVNGSLWKYNFITDCWVRINCTNFPQELKFNSLYLSGNILFIHGVAGIHSFNDLKFKTFIGDLSNDRNGSGVEFEEIHTTGRIPAIGYSQQIIIDGQYLYSLYGMAEHEHEMDVYRLDLSTKKWDLLCEARGLHENVTQKFKHDLAFYNNKIYMFGRSYFPSSNRSVQNITIFQKIQVFDVLTKEWKYFKTLEDVQSSSNYFPYNRINHGFAQCVVEKKFVYICGGGNGRRNSFNDIWRFNLDTLQWHELKSFLLPDPSHMHSMVITPEGQMYYHDGISRQHMNNSDKVYSAWVSMPSLKTISWDAMLHYFKKQMLNSSDTKLKSLGLPLEYYNSVISAKKSL